MQATRNELKTAAKLKFHAESAKSCCIAPRVDIH
jgi:hypothetical protein